MLKKRSFNFFVMGALLCIMLAYSEVQGESNLITGFISPRIKNHQSDDLKATKTSDGGVLTIKVKAKSSQRPEDGWAGACIESSAEVNLRSFTHVKATIESSARVIMDIKLERKRCEQGTILLVDADTIGKGKKNYTWSLKESYESTGGDTLMKTKRMCFFVLADDFPKGLKEVTVKVSNVTFDRM